MGEGTEVEAAVVFPQARQREAGNGVVEVDLQEEELLVVLEVDIEARLKFLNEPTLQQQRLRLVLDHVPIEVVDGIDQGVELEIPAHAPRGVEVLGDPLAKVASLPDVNDRAESVFVQVDTRTVRYRGQFISDVVSDRHGPRTASSGPDRQHSLFPGVLPVGRCEETRTTRENLHAGLAISGLRRRGRQRSSRGCK